MGRLQDKVCVITGAGGGIGRASAKMFAAEGGIVVVTDIIATAAEEVAHAIVSAGGRAMALTIDVGEEDQLRRMIDSTVGEYGRIDVLYNNALFVNQDFVMRDLDFLTFDPEVFYANMRVNVLGGVLASKIAIPHMLEQVGGAEAMLEIVEAESPKKPIVTTTYKNRTESGVVLHDIGKIAAQLDTAKLLLFSATGLLDEIALSRREFTVAEKAKHKAQCAQVVELVHAAIEGLMFIAGSSAFALDKPISSFWKDIHVGLRHITNVPMLSYEIYGRNRLGVANISPPGAF